MVKYRDFFFFKVASCITTLESFCVAAGRVMITALQCVTNEGSPVLVQYVAVLLTL